MYGTLTEDKAKEVAYQHKNDHPGGLKAELSGLVISSEIHGLLQVLMELSMILLTLHQKVLLKSRLHFW